MFCRNAQVLRAEHAKSVATFEKLLAQASGEPDIDAGIVEDGSDSGDEEAGFGAAEMSRKGSFSSGRRGSEAFTAASLAALSAVVNLRRSSSAAYHKPDEQLASSRQRGLSRPVSAAVLRLVSISFTAALISVKPHHFYVILMVKGLRKRWGR
jgi:hypothetical protein